MDKPRYDLIVSAIVGGVLVVVGLIVLINSTDFDPNPFLEDETNPMGQLMGVIVGAAGLVVATIAIGAGAVCRALQRNTVDN